MGESHDMNKNDKLIILLGVIILAIAAIGIFIWDASETTTATPTVDDMVTFTGTYEDMLPTSIKVSDKNPFLSLVATPVAVHYTDEGEQHIVPLFIENFEDPSRAVIRAESMIGKPASLTLGCTQTETITDISIELAETYWKQSQAALIIENSQIGYNLGVAATPMATYLRIPIIVTDEIDTDVQSTLRELGIQYLFTCGNFTQHGMQEIELESPMHILNITRSIVKERFGTIEYITLTNPSDTLRPKVLNSTSHHFEGTLSSNSITIGHLVNMAVGSLLKGTPVSAMHEFEIPEEYEYSRVTIHAKNLVDEDIDETGSQLTPMFYDPDGNWLALTFTVGGIPERDSSGDIITDQVTWDTTIYDQPGTYSINVYGQYIASKTGDYEIDVTVEELESAVFPNMPNLSSIAPYLTSYHQGILYANPDFTFVGDERIIENPNPGVVFPASNPELIDESNEHTFKIHESINDILASIREINVTTENDLKFLKESYDKNPVYISLVGDARMIPQYYYYDTEDACTLQYGWDVASDFIYGNIDPVPRDDKISIHPRDKFLSTYDEKYPHQENIVGRITGWDAQDASALVARTVFYEDIVEYLDDWKDTALVQTGSGTDFQRVPFVDLLRKVLGARDLTFKWPTGEAHFHNLIIQDHLRPGGFDIIATENAKSMRKGLSDEVINEINTMGISNLIFFPKQRAKLVVGADDITGGEDQMNSNYIFSFGHGQPMGFSHGDVQTNSIGFRPVLLQNIFNRFFFGTFLPQLSSGLGNVGGYNVRAVSNMDLGPSVVFVESCYIGRIDGFPAKCLTSQAYLHAGVNSFVASSRGSPGPGYLDARARPKGFGLVELAKTTLNPDLQNPHFSALIASDMFTDLIKNDVDVGTAFRNARNQFMDDADSEFFWTPPLSLQINTEQDLDLLFDNMKSSSNGDLTRMEKKYTCQLEYNVLGDPAFNPYEPTNQFAE